MDNRIGELRKEKGLTLKQLAEKFELRDNTLSQYETGKRQPSIELLFLLADFFEVSIDYLMKQTNERVKEIKNLREALDVVNKIKTGELQYGDISINNKVEIAKIFLKHKETLKFISEDSDPDIEQHLKDILQEIENFIFVAYDEDSLRLSIKNEFDTNIEIINEINLMLYKHIDYHGATPKQILEFMYESERINKSDIDNVLSYMKGLPDNELYNSISKGDD